jgi:hypothetical protein
VLGHKIGKEAIRLSIAIEGNGRRKDQRLSPESNSIRE